MFAGCEITSELRRLSENGTKPSSRSTSAASGLDLERHEVAEESTERGSVVSPDHHQERHGVSLPSGDRSLWLLPRRRKTRQADAVPLLKKLPVFADFAKP